MCFGVGGGVRATDPCALRDISLSVSSGSQSPVPNNAAFHVRGSGQVLHNSLCMLFLARLIVSEKAKQSLGRSKTDPTDASSPLSAELAIVMNATERPLEPPYCLLDFRLREGAKRGRDVRLPAGVSEGRRRVARFAATAAKQ